MFASYGSPYGGCAVGFTVADDCHHTASHRSLETLCLGKESCTVSAVPGFWAQYGTMKNCSRLVKHGERKHLALVRRTGREAQSAWVQGGILLAIR